MSGKGKETAQRLLAIIVIIAMLAVMGIPPSVIIFFAVVTYFVWRAVQRSEHQETGRIFEFYIHANDILRDEERRWYGFEVLELIQRGERVLHSMHDPPPLVFFTLGALYHRVGNHEAAVEHLSYVVENEAADELQRFVPTAELRRYVQILRKLEREPAEAPQTMAAVRSLDRARRTRASALLAASRERLNAAPALAPRPVADQTHPAETSLAEQGANRSPSAQGQVALAPPPPIAEVLRDLYEEEKKTA